MRVGGDSIVRPAIPLISCHPISRILTPALDDGAHSIPAHTVSLFACTRFSVSELESS